MGRDEDPEGGRMKTRKGGMKVCGWEGMKSCGKGRDEIL